MIYTFNLENDIFKYLQKELGGDNIKSISKPHKLKKITKEGDFVIFFGWSEGMQKLQKLLLDKRVRTTFANTMWLRDKITQLNYIDTKELSRYGLKRVFIRKNFDNLLTMQIPKLDNESEKVVVKIGNEHYGKGKYLRNAGDIINSKENIIFEEYVEDARSIQIIMIGLRIFIVEYMSDNWIVNKNPEKKVYSFNERYELNIANIDNVIRDAMTLGITLKMAYFGADYVVSNEQIGLIKVNDMIKIPKDKRIVDAAKEHWLRFIRANSESTTIQIMSEESEGSVE